MKLRHMVATLGFLAAAAPVCAQTANTTQPAITLKNYPEGDGATNIISYQIVGAYRQKLDRYGQNGVTNNKIVDEAFIACKMAAAYILIREAERRLEVDKMFNHPPGTAKEGSLIPNQPCPTPERYRLLGENAFK